MVENRSYSRIIFNIINYGLLVLFCFICIAPLWHVLMSSFSEPRLLMASSGLQFWPLGNATLRGYELVFINDNIFTGYMNTFIYVGSIAFFGTVLTMIAGFVLSRKTKLQKPMTIFVLFTMMFSGGLLPSFIVNLNLGIVNTRWAIILPSLMNAFYIVIMKSAFEQLPSSFEESAKLDGAGPVRVLVNILAPLVKATTAVIVMFTLILQWNAWFPAAIYLQMRRDLWPLQLFMREVLVQHDTARILHGADAQALADLSSNLVRYSITIVGTLPILAVYPFAQKYFIQGITLGGVKG